MADPASAPQPAEAPEPPQNYKHELTPEQKEYIDEMWTKFKEDGVVTEEERQAVLAKVEAFQTENNGGVPPPYIPVGTYTPSAGDAAPPPPVPAEPDLTKSPE